MRSSSWPSCTAGSSPQARACWHGERDAASASAAASCSTSCPRRERSARASGTLPRHPRIMQQRWVEITGPTDRKMMINALNSGADGFMADFEDANSPTWQNMVEGHINLRDAIERHHLLRQLRRPPLRAEREPATLLVRPRGWHLPERHLYGRRPARRRGAVRLRPVLLPLRAPAAAHAAGARTSTCPSWSPISRRGCGTTCSSSPRMRWASRAGTIKATVLIETLPAAFEMDEILYELREHSAGLNAGRWDYIFSAIKCFPDRPEMVLPDRGAGDHDRAVHARLHRAAGRHVPSARRPCDGRAWPRSSPRAATRRPTPRRSRAYASDKQREVGQGYDGTWVAHPDLVPVAREVFERGLRWRAQPARAPSRRRAGERRRHCWTSPRRPGKITEAGLRTDVSVGFQYISFWLTRPRRRGDQLVDGGRRHRRDLALADLAMGPSRGRARATAGRSPGSSSARSSTRRRRRFARAWGRSTWRAGRPAETREIFERVALATS